MAHRKLSNFSKVKKRAFVLRNILLFFKDYFDDDKAFSDSVFKFLFSNTRVKRTFNGLTSHAYFNSFVQRILTLLRIFNYKERFKCKIKLFLNKINNLKGIFISNGLCMAVESKKAKCSKCRLQPRLPCPFLKC